MKHEHKKCEHNKLKYCSKCDVVYCEECEKEWGNCGNTITFPYHYDSGTAGSTLETTFFDPNKFYCNEHD